MQNAIESRLAQARQLEVDGKDEAAADAYAELVLAHPGLIAAHLRLSVVWQRLDQYRKSRASLQAAVESLVQAKSWKALPFVTLRLLAFGERLLIRKLIASADWNAPAVLAQSPTLSQHLWLSGDFDESLRMIDKASGRMPANPLLSYSRANALRYIGRMEEATSELERCIAMSPNYHFAHWTLASHAGPDSSGVRIDRIRRAASASAADPVARTYLAYALFKELDVAGDTVAAWQALSEGARLKRASIEFDGKQETTSIAALHQMAKSMEPPKHAPASDYQVPLLVVGLPRTGTTILERILSNHPDVATAGELSNLTHALSESVDGFVASPPTLRDVARLDSLDFAAAGKTYLEATAPYAQGRRFLVDKNPSNVFHAWAIARAVPGARILCLQRDPMDACFSNYKELFSGVGYGYSYDFCELARHHQAFVETIDCWQSILPEQFMVVRYESLVSDPLGVTAKVVSFCGLQSRDNLADITANAAPVLTASSAQVKEPIHERNIGGWMRYAEQLRPLQESLARH